jgi:hypothetical protein
MQNGRISAHSIAAATCFGGSEAPTTWYKNKKNTLMELFDMACLLQQVNQVRLLKPLRKLIGVKLWMMNIKH